MSLTTLVSGELGAILGACESTYDTLDKFIIGKREQVKRTQSTIRIARERIRNARLEYDQLASRETLDFSLENMILLQRSIHALEKGLPDQETTATTVEVLSQSLDRHTSTTIYKKIRSGLPESAQWATLASIGSFYLDSNLAGTIYASGAAAGLWEMFSERESFKRAFWANGANLIGALALGLTNFHNKLPPDQSTLLFVTSVLHILTYPQIQLLFKYRYNKANYDSEASSLQNNRIDFDNFMRSATIIPEAIDTWRYVNNIRRREERPNMFRGQMERLESTLTNYFQGRATLDDVIAARIRYTPKVRIPPKLNKKLQRPPAVDSETNLEEEPAPSRKRYQPERAAVKALPTPTPQYEPPMQVSVVLDQNLSSIYDTRQQIGGYSIRPLIDLTRVKIERNPNGEVIKDAGTGQYLLRRLRKRHDLPSGLTVFKMQPIGSLRAIYMRQGDTINVLEILTHSQYERMMKPN